MTDAKARWSSFAVQSSFKGASIFATRCSLPRPFWRFLPSPILSHNCLDAILYVNIWKLWAREDRVNERHTLFDWSFEEWNFPGCCKSFSFRFRYFPFRFKITLKWERLSVNAIGKQISHHCRSRLLEDLQVQFPCSQEFAPSTWTHPPMNFCWWYHIPAQILGIVSASSSTLRRFPLYLHLKNPIWSKSHENMLSHYHSPEIRGSFSFH